MAPLAGRAAFLALSCLPRAASKGCFTETAEVTMADGTRRALRDVRAGDRVMSYDEAAGATAPSEVMATPVFFRNLADLVEVSLPSAFFRATEDHPLWSRSRGQLVSFHPDSTEHEYDLRASLMVVGEELEDEHQQPVPVVAVERLLGGPGPTPEARQLRGAAGTNATVRVRTLCLQPHHWYYVHGVRVHNKGCFLEDAEVTLADGSRRALKDISAGDRVASWDEVAQRRAVSTVRAKPVFQRHEHELVELALPEARVFATEDHPFWSRSRGSLVSLHPNATRREYQLSAQLMTPGEELDGEAQQAVTLLGVRRVADLNASALHLRQLRGAPDAVLRARAVEVMTLCLEPHHWFYVHGVRVHNKGCFAPWTPILMADGTHKPIEDVRVDDRVTSWDETAGRLTEAAVIGVDAFPGRSMLNISFSAPRLVAHRRLGGAEEGLPMGGKAASLIVTHDHPIYSARSRGLVSMRPNMTLELYAMAVGQMREQELLHHHQGHHLPAQVMPWAGNTSRVMTLRLDRYHWFYAHGVRVHNKGGGVGGGSFGGGSRTVYTSSSMGTRSYATFIIMSGGSRRRYGTYDNEGNCNMHDSATVKQQCRNHISTWCTKPLSDMDSPCCHDCLDCQDEACISRIAGCENFLNGAFSECTEGGEMNMGLIIGMIAGLGVFGGVAWFVFQKIKTRRADSTSKFAAESILTRRSARDALVAEQGLLPPNLAFSGTYSENGETKTTTYNLNISNGIVNGFSHDDDGRATVTGKVCASSGDLALMETRDGVHIEITGTLMQSPSGAYEIRADYISSYLGTEGRLFLQSAAVGAVVGATASRRGSEEGTQSGHSPPPPIVQANVVGQTVIPGTLVSYGR